MQKIERIKQTNNADRRQLRSRGVILTWLVLGSLVVTLAGAPLTGMIRTADARSFPISQPALPDQPLSASAAAELVQILTDETENALDDFFDVNQVNSTKANIVAKFNGRGTQMGKTATQIADALYADVQTVVTEKDVLETVRANLSAVVNENNSAPTTSATPVLVNGMNVTEVEYGNNGQTGGTYRQVGDKKWNGVNAANQITATCNETGRDEWSVYLQCADRSSAMLNLWRKEVTVTPNNGTSTLIGMVVRSGSGAVTDPGTTGGNTQTAPSATTGNPSSAAELKQYIKGLSYDPRVLLSVKGNGGEIVQEDVLSRSNPTREEGNGKIIRCISTQKSLSNNFKDIAILQPTEGVIYPGALIYGDQSLVDGLPRQLTELKRAPIKVRLDLPGLQEEGSFTVNEPNNGDYQSGLNRALNFWNNGPSYQEGYVSPQRLYFDAATAYSSEQLGLELGVNVRWASGDAAAQFKYSSSKEKNVVVALFKQVFYTVQFQAPNSPEQFFDPSVSAEEARSVFNNQSPPAYVSGVNYGRLIMFRLETDKSVTAVDAQAALNYGTGQPTGFDVNLKAKYDQIISNSKVTAVAMGGNAEASAEVVSARKAKDLEPIIKGKNAVYSKNNPGVPIAYTVKFVKDNAVAKIGSSTDFTETTCEQLPNIFVKVVHSGGFVGFFKFTYDVPNSTGTGTVPAKPIELYDKTASFQQTVNFPGDATNIRLRMWNATGLVWQPEREIMNRILQPADYNKCFQVVGTTLGSTFNNDCS